MTGVRQCRRRRRLGPPPDFTELVRSTRTDTPLPPIGDGVVPAALASSLLTLTVTTPCRPMLARPVRSFDEDRLRRALSAGAVYEEKYDGERLLCSVGADTVTFYTRTLNETTFPHAVTLNAGYVDCVLDGERVYVDPDTGVAVPLCDTGPRDRLSQRYRVFDVQYVNGRHTFATPLRERKLALAACLRETRHVSVVLYSTAATTDELRSAFRDTVAAGGEGLVVKSLDSVYTPGGRAHWLKLKPLHLHEYREEYDLFAHRAIKDKNGLSYGALECGYYAPQYVHVCKVGSGVSAAVSNRVSLLVDPLTGLFRRRTVVCLAADKITTGGRDRSLRHPALLCFKFDRDTVDVSPFVDDSSLFLLRRRRRRMGETNNYSELKKR